MQNTIEAIRDKYYEMWSAHYTWLYRDLVNAAHKDNPLHALVLLVTNYHGQVYNGGHMQYRDNGYADGEGSFGLPHESTEMHDMMLDLMRTYQFNTLPQFRSIYTIASLFKNEQDEVCSVCLGDGEIESYDTSDLGEYEICPECDGSGYVTNTNDISYYELDTLYYDVSKSFITDLETFITEKESQNDHSQLQYT